jgi:hypothetical protein
MEQTATAQGPGPVQPHGDRRQGKDWRSVSQMSSSNIARERWAFRSDDPGSGHGTPRSVHVYRGVRRISARSTTHQGFGLSLAIALQLRWRVASIAKQTCLFLVLASGFMTSSALAQRAIAEREEFLAVTRSEPGVQQAVDTSVATLDDFVAAWKNKGRLQREFCLVVCERRGSVLQPLGIRLLEVAGSSFRGEAIENDNRDAGVPSQEVLTVPQSAVIDWHFLDGYELEGGALYRYLFHESAFRTRFFSLDQLMFYVRKPNGISVQDRAVYSAVINRDPPVIREVVRQHPNPFELKLTMPSARAPGGSSKHEFTLAGFCAAYGDAAAIRELCGLCPDLELSPILSIACRRNPETVRELVSLGADVNGRGKYGVSPLFDAIGASQFETFEFLLEAGADPFYVNVENNGSLHWVAGHASPELPYFKRLIAEGCDVNLKNKYGKTPLHQLLDTDEPNMEAADYLRSQGARVEPKLPYRAPLLPREEVIRLLEKAAKSRGDVFERDPPDFGNVLPVKSFPLSVTSPEQTP